MEEFFKQNPLAIAACVAGFVLVSWVSNTVWLGLLGAIAGFWFGHTLDAKRLVGGRP